MFGTRVSFEFGLQLQKHIGIQDDERRMASTRYRIDTFRYRTWYRIDTKIMVSTRHQNQGIDPALATSTSRYIVYFQLVDNVTAGTSS